MKERVYTENMSFEEERPEYYFKHYRLCRACGEFGTEFVNDVCLKCGDEKRGKNEQNK